MSHVFHRSSRAVPRVAARASGLTITDKDGKTYLDACGGAAVSCLGHGDADVEAAIASQLGKIAYAHTSFFTTEAAERLADRLIEDAPQGLDRCYFVTDGSEAIETAIKMAHQYHRERGEPSRTHVIARQQSYHGNTLGALSAGGNAMRRATYGDLMIPVMSHIDPCWSYRLRREDESEAEYGLRAANLLEAEILQIGPQNVSCFVAETVVGATLGCVAPSPGYLSRIREICDAHGVLLILDEVMCGMGRTGTLHACEQEGVTPDILVIAKGLGAGYIPLGAAICTAEIHDAFRDGSGAFMHGHTFVAHPVACAAALAVQDAVKSRNLLANVRARGDQLITGLRERLGQNPHVGDIRGRGLFIGVELVADRATKAPFDPAAKLNQRIKSEAMAAGLLIYPMGGTLDGKRGDHVLLAPPYTASAAEIETIGELTALSIERALGGT